MKGLSAASPKRIQNLKKKLTSVSFRLERVERKAQSLFQKQWKNDTFISWKALERWDDITTGSMKRKLKLARKQLIKRLSDNSGTLDNNISWIDKSKKALEEMIPKEKKKEKKKKSNYLRATTHHPIGMKHLAKGKSKKRLQSPDTSR